MSVPAPHASDLRLSLNGEPVVLPTGAALSDAVAMLTSAATGIATALNATVVPRSDWAGRLLADGDTVEVLTAVQGG